MEILISIIVALVTLLGQHGDAGSAPEHSGAKTMYIQPSPCAGIDWQARDVDGRVMLPYDANGDGFIDCGSDIELGA